MGTLYNDEFQYIVLAYIFNANFSHLLWYILISGICGHLTLGGQDRAAVKCLLGNDKDVGSNPAAAKQKTDIGGSPPQ